MGLVMGIILAIMLPLSRIFRGCAQLRDIEARIEHTGDGMKSGVLLNELNSLERRTEKITVPLSYTNERYALRANIQRVRRKLQA